MEVYGLKTGCEFLEKCEKLIIKIGSRTLKIDNFFFPILGSPTLKIISKIFFIAAVIIKSHPPNLFLLKKLFKVDISHATSQCVTKRFRFFAALFVKKKKL